MLDEKHWNKSIKPKNKTNWISLTEKFSTTKLEKPNLSITFEVNLIDCKSLLETSKI